MTNLNPKFEDFLSDKFIKQYTGIKDNVEDAENMWLEDLAAEELVAYEKEFEISQRPSIDEMLEHISRKTGITLDNISNNTKARAEKLRADIGDIYEVKETK